MLPPSSILSYRIVIRVWSSVGSHSCLWHDYSYFTLLFIGVISFSLWKVKRYNFHSNGQFVANRDCIRTSVQLIQFRYFNEQFKKPVDNSFLFFIRLLFCCTKCAKLLVTRYTRVQTWIKQNVAIELEKTMWKRNS